MVPEIDDPQCPDAPGISENYYFLINEKDVIPTVQPYRKSVMFDDVVTSERS